MMRRIFNGVYFPSGDGVCLKAFALLSLTVFLGSALGVKAQGNLIVNPRRIVLEGSKRLCELNVANTGKDTAVYAISVINIRMTKEGAFEVINTPDSMQRFAGDYIRFFPKRVVLAPNEAQVVKVQLTQTNKLEPGEYRSHLYFRAVPQEQPLGKPEEAQNTESISVKINALFGLSIPVIVRVGEPQLKITMDEMTCVKANDSTYQLNLTFNREGNVSAYGNLHVDYISPKGDTKEAAEVKGIAIYTPNKSRMFSLTLDRKYNNEYKKGKLHLTYSTDIRSEKPSEAELTLQ